MSAQYRNLSLRLFEILDEIGASEETRDNYRAAAIVDEILSTHIYGISSDKPIKQYVFGSYCEGTTTQGLNSDKDLLICCNSTVVDSISRSTQNGPSFLMVTDETTKPGYVKLQLAINKCPVNRLFITHNLALSILAVKYRSDNYGRICLKHVPYRDDHFREHNGPATTRLGEKGIRDIDIVVALECQYIPSCAKSWLRRVVSCDRLNEAQRQILKESGCFFVGINHPSSQNGSIEWRLSFSLQERELMTSLNSTQHKCYVFLKMIKKDIIHKRAPKSISSYHCKTCVLYAIEKTPCVFWRREHFLECIRFCIKILLHWVKENRCPNYFVPDENMFDRFGYRTLRQVQDILEDMLEHWCNFLWSLTCDNIGEVLYAVLFGRGPSIMRVQRKTISEQTLCLYGNFIFTLKKRNFQFLMMCRSRSAAQAVLELHSIETSFMNTDCVEKHTEEETKSAICFFIPYIRLQIAQCVASIMLATRNADLLRMMFSKFEYYIEESKDCDFIASYLIVASYCLQSKRLGICERILLKCETSLKSSHVMPVCGCNSVQQLYLHEHINQHLRILMSQRIQIKEYTRTCTTGCLTFLPHQANLIPPALHYEMYRSVNTPAGSRDKLRDVWFDWIVVDSKVYLYFLQYVLFLKTNKAVPKQDAIDNLIHIMTRDENLGHLETAYNLLGWIYTQENKIQHALECFLTSWRIRPIHNAAKWHMLDIISSRNTLN